MPFYSFKNYTSNKTESSLSNSKTPITSKSSLNNDTPAKLSGSSLKKSYTSLEDKERSSRDFLDHQQEYRDSQEAETKKEKSSTKKSVRRTSSAKISVDLTLETKNNSNSNNQNSESGVGEPSQENIMDRKIHKRTSSRESKKSGDSYWFGLGFLTKIRNFSSRSCKGQQKIVRSKKLTN